MSDEKCGNVVFLAADAIAATYAPEDPPRQLECELSHPHKGPHRSDGWMWEDFQIWKEQT